jgi:hypothetical protein
VARDEGDGDGDGVEIDLYEIRSGSTDEQPTRTRTHRASATEHEVKRRQFASGPGANDAAHMLERAFGLRAPASVVAEFAPRTLRCVKHRFDQGMSGAERNGP